MDQLSPADNMLATTGLRTRSMHWNKAGNCLIVPVTTPWDTLDRVTVPYWKGRTADLALFCEALVATNPDAFPYGFGAASLMELLVREKWRTDDLMFDIPQRPLPGYNPDGTVTYTELPPRRLKLSGLRLPVFYEPGGQHFLPIAPLAADVRALEVRATITGGSSCPYGSTAFEEARSLAWPED